MSIYAGKGVKIRCPKCRSESFVLTETIEEHVLYEVTEGKMPDCATDHIPGGVLGLSAECNACNHVWKPRGRALGDVVVE